MSSRLNIWLTVFAVVLVPLAVASYRLVATTNTYLGTSLAMPYPRPYFMWLAWILMLVVALGVARHKSWTPLVLALALAVWVLVMLLGESLLGWTA